MNQKGPFFSKIGKILTPKRDSRESRLSSKNNPFFVFLWSCMCTTLLFEWPPPGCFSSGGDDECIRNYFKNCWQINLFFNNLQQKYLCLFFFLLSFPHLPQQNWKSIASKNYSKNIRLPPDQLRTEIGQPDIAVFIWCLLSAALFKSCHV